MSNPSLISKIVSQPIFTLKSESGYLLGIIIAFLIFNMVIGFYFVGIYYNNVEKKISKKYQEGMETALWLFFLPILILIGCLILLIRERKKFDIEDEIVKDIINITKQDIYKEDLRNNLAKYIKAQIGNNTSYKINGGLVDENKIKDWLQGNATLTYGGTPIASPTDKSILDGNNFTNSSDFISSIKQGDPYDRDLIINKINNVKAIMDNNQMTNNEKMSQIQNTFLRYLSETNRDATQAGAFRKLLLNIITKDPNSNQVTPIIGNYISADGALLNGLSTSINLNAALKNKILSSNDLSNLNIGDFGDGAKTALSALGITGDTLRDTYNNNFYNTPENIPKALDNLRTQQDFINERRDNIIKDTTLDNPAKKAALEALKAAQDSLVTQANTIATTSTIPQNYEGYIAAQQADIAANSKKLDTLIANPDAPTPDNSIQKLALYQQQYNALKQDFNNAINNKDTNPLLAKSELERIKNAIEQISTNFVGNSKILDSPEKMMLGSKLSMLKDTVVSNQAALEKTPISSYTNFLTNYKDDYEKINNEIQAIINNSSLDNQQKINALISENYKLETLEENVENTKEKFNNQDIPAGIKMELTEKATQLQAAIRENFNKTIDSYNYLANTPTGSVENFNKTIDNLITTKNNIVNSNADDNTKNTALANLLQQYDAIINNILSTNLSIPMKNQLITRLGIGPENNPGNIYTFNDSRIPLLKASTPNIDNNTPPNIDNNALFTEIDNLEKNGRDIYFNLVTQRINAMVDGINKDKQIYTYNAYDDTLNKLAREVNDNSNNIQERVQAAQEYKNVLEQFKKYYGIASGINGGVGFNTNGGGRGPGGRGPGGRGPGGRGPGGRGPGGRRGGRRGP